MSYDEKRILQVFETNEIPNVSDETLDIYLEYIKKNLICPCVLTGIESMGYFSWEERYSFGYGNKKQYGQLRKENGSYKDEYKLQKFNGKVEWDVLVKVVRISDKKKFEIPLSELQPVDKKSSNYPLLNDYTVWFVNWH